MIMRHTSPRMTRVRQSIVYLYHRSTSIFLPFQGDYHKQDVHPPDDCSRHQQVDVPHEEQKKKWYDLDDDRKKQLEVQISLAFTLYPCQVHS
jgi:hypothetical protein